MAVSVCHRVVQYTHDRYQPILISHGGWRRFSTVHDSFIKETVQFKTLHEFVYEQPGLRGEGPADADVVNIRVDQAGQLQSHHNQLLDPLRISGRAGRAVPQPSHDIHNKLFWVHGTGGGPEYLEQRPLLSHYLQTVIEGTEITAGECWE